MKTAAALALLIAAPASAPLADDFRHGLGRWRIEAEPGARVAARGGVLEIDAPDGVTVWFARTLAAPVRIEFEAMPVARGGPNDAVSDLNAFWMAHEPDGSAPRRRGGKFEEYDSLRTYYLGIGGNRNTTTRMRRYVGRAGERPLLPEHDRGDPAALLHPNGWTHVALIADARGAAVERDGCLLFRLDDAALYRRGWFGLRTTRSHLLVRNVRIGRHASLSRTPRCPAPPPAKGRAGGPAPTPAAGAP